MAQVWVRGKGGRREMCESVGVMRLVMCEAFAAASHTWMLWLYHGCHQSCYAPVVLAESNASCKIGAKCGS